MKDDEMTILSVRVPQEWIERLDRLTALLAVDSEYKAFRLTRSTVCRRAIQIGLSSLEDGHLDGQ